MSYKINIYNGVGWNNILSHDNLTDAQGGITGEKYHLTADQESFIDQDVANGASPTFNNTNMSGDISVWNNDSDFITESEVALNVFTQTTPASAWSINHNFGSKYVLVQIYKDDDTLIAPEKVELIDNNNLSIQFNEAISGYAIYSKISGTVPASNPTEDHGSLTGLSGDDHNQYTLVDGTRGFTSTISGITPSSSADLTTKQYVDNKTWLSTDITDFDTAVNANTNVSNNITHRTSSGVDHTWLDQDVTIGSAPQFSITNMYGGISNFTNDSNFITSASVTYESLNTNGDIGTGVTQVAKGDHNHNQLFYTYSVAGDIDISAGWTDLWYDTEDTKDSIYTFSNDKEITVGTTGLYEINYSVSTYITTHVDDTESLVKIQMDDGNGYVDVDGSFSGLFNYSSTYGLNSAAKTILLSLSTNDKVKIQAKRNNGSSTIKTFPNSCTLLMKYKR